MLLFQQSWCCSFDSTTRSACCSVLLQASAFEIESAYCTSLDLLYGWAMQGVCGVWARCGPGVGKVWGMGAIPLAPAHG